MRKVSSIDYMCTWCGTHSLRTVHQGRPLPGNCPRKSKMRNGMSKPHTWVINKKFYFNGG